MSVEELTVIIPCKNEAQNVEDALVAVFSVIPDLNLHTNILLVNDGSTDETESVMQKLCAKYPSCRLITNKKNLGLGRTVINCYNHIPDDHWVTVFPGDNELVFGSIRNLLNCRKEYDLILGYFQNPIIRTGMRRLASAIFTFVVKIIYGYPYQYLNGMKLYKVKIFKGIEVVSSGHAFNAELLAKAILRNPNLRIGEAPFIARGRSSGSTKAFRLKSVLTAVRDIVIGYKSVSAYRNVVISEDLKKKNLDKNEIN